LYVSLAKQRVALAKMLAELGKHGESLGESDKALALYRKVAGDPPTRFQSALMDALYQRGHALQKLARPSEAVGAYREAIALGEKLVKPTSDDLYNISCDYALLHGLSRDKGSGVSAADAAGAGEKAVATLRRAIMAGYRDTANLRKDTDLDSVRKRHDFEKLLADLETELKASKK
jgi:serine/threonine-protein kinase